MYLFPAFVEVSLKKFKKNFFTFCGKTRVIKIKIKKNHYVKYIKYTYLIYLIINLTFETRSGNPFLSGSAVRVGLT